MKEIVLCTDGSFKNKTQANAAIIYDKSNIYDKTLIYRTGKGKNSEEAEINSVIHGLEYIKEYNAINQEDCLIEVRSDLIFLVEFINEKLYKEWNNNDWINGPRGRVIKTGPRLWYKLMLLIKHFGEENVISTKVTQKEDDIHKIVDKVAYNMLKINNMKLQTFYKTTIKDFSNIADLINSSEVIKVPEMKLDKSKSKLPWCVSKRNARKETKKMHEIENKLTDMSWFEKLNDRVGYIPTNNIILQEEIHLNCYQMNFNGKLKEYSETDKVDKPIVIKKISEDKYALVMGIQRYFAAKILDIEFIPAIVTDYNNSDFNIQMQELITDEQIAK
ncbi:ParB N-terminal domain-containing protein [Clostridium sp. SHJSY1]|uniref:ParB N-terminal domain-containing protein n=1 Tax=Clostridium sp. SHJSY1 TaxID=2942483 RepID=UPI00287494F2|nr:ParB N-terminal domain-containing protein [Clostridium sp. SHJSY1]MDS0527123.1 ParB N-terminal domain-containing protein [Clostridium sp. SHJSY1]